MRRIGFIGGGRVVRIMLQAMQNEKMNVERIVVSDPDRKNLEKLVRVFADLKVTAGSNLEAAAQEVVFLALHPPMMKEVLAEIAAAVQRAQAVVSLAPVFKAEKIAALLNDYKKIARMIPNAATLMNRGYNPVWLSRHIGQSGKSSLMNFFKALGDCPEVDEDKLEAYAILTAMGPTYLWPQLQELHQLSLEFGLTEEETRAGMKAMVSNTVELLYDSGLSYEEVVDLIPVKPLGESEAEIRALYSSKLCGLYNKLTGKEICRSCASPQSAKSHINR
ncbi:NAD(P)-binding domain-containing protein [candidate division KSB1 bacterium]|nr:NAD(P)-binding domain-containing protein [candidate division KSB1 bacterium]